MHESLERAAMQRKSLLVVIKSPSEQLSAIMGDVKLNFFSCEGQSGIEVLIDKSELNLKFLPKLLIYLWDLAVGFFESSIALKLMDFLLALETGLSEPFFP